MFAMPGQRSHSKKGYNLKENQSAKGTEMTDSMKAWQKSEFL